jgi:hypothetical protein
MNVPDTKLKAYQANGGVHRARRSTELYEVESVDMTEMEVKQLQTEAMGFIYVSLGSSTVQLHDSLGSRCACSEGGFSSQNGDRA